MSDKSVHVEKTDSSTPYAVGCAYGAAPVHNTCGQMTEEAPASVVVAANAFLIEHESLVGLTAPFTYTGVAHIDVDESARPYSWKYEVRFTDAHATMVEVRCWAAHAPAFCVPRSCRGAACRASAASCPSLANGVRACAPSSHSSRASVCRAQVDVSPTLTLLEIEKRVTADASPDWVKAKLAEVQSEHSLSACAGFEHSYVFKNGVFADNQWEHESCLTPSGELYDVEMSVSDKSVHVEKTDSSTPYASGCAYGARRS